MHHLIKKAIKKFEPHYLWLSTNFCTPTSFINPCVPFYALTIVLQAL